MRRPYNFNLIGNFWGQPVVEALLSYSGVPEESARLQLQEDCPLIHFLLASRFTGLHALGRYSCLSCATALPS